MISVMMVAVDVVDVKGFKDEGVLSGCKIVESEVE